MKALFGILVLVMASCSSQNTGDIDLKNIQQTWRLVKMTGSLQSSETTGSDMAWQETILLSNGLFEKTRIINGSSTKVSGSYAFSEESDGTYLVLKYRSANSLIGNCTGDLTEYYFMTSDESFHGTWLACDGPGLEYQLVN